MNFCGIKHFKTCKGFKISYSSIALLQFLQRLHILWSTKMTQTISNVGKNGHTSDNLR